MSLNLCPALLFSPPLLQEIEAGKVWKGTKAPAIGVDYWKLKPGADMRDLILAVRADEVCVYGWW